MSIIYVLQGGKVVSPSPLLNPDRLSNFMKEVPDKVVYFTLTFMASNRDIHGFERAASHSPDITGLGSDSGGTVGRGGLEEVGNGDLVQATSVVSPSFYAGDEWGVDWSGCTFFTGGSAVGYWPVIVSGRAIIARRVL